jgi:anti-sigma regulatory factor (Ser/Thr protein kinase)
VGHAAADPAVDGLAHEGVIPKAKAALMASVKWRREKPVEVRMVMVDAFKNETAVTLAHCGQKNTRSKPGI